MQIEFICQLSHNRQTTSLYGSRYSITAGCSGLFITLEQTQQRIAIWSLGIKKRQSIANSAEPIKIDSGIRVAIKIEHELTQIKFAEFFIFSDRNILIGEITKRIQLLI